MLKKIRRFIHDKSPDWLNVEVNKDFLTNFSEAVTSKHNTLPQNHLALNLTKENLTSPLTIPPSPLTRSPSPDRIKGKPHYRRILQVFEVLDNAPSGSTYTQLVNHVREVTGRGCSRKLISKWKKYKQLPISSQQSLTNSDRLSISNHNTATNFQSINQPLVNNSSLLTTTVAASAMMIGLIGCSANNLSELGNKFNPIQNNAIASEITSVTEPTTPTTIPTVRPKPKQQK